MGEHCSADGEKPYQPTFERRVCESQVFTIFHTFFADFHRFSSQILVDFLRFSQIFVDFHRFSQSFFVFRRFSQIFLYFPRFSQIFIDFRRFSLIFVDSASNRYMCMYRYTHNYPVIYTYNRMCAYSSMHVHMYIHRCMCISL